MTAGARLIVFRHAVFRAAQCLAGEHPGRRKMRDSNRAGCVIQTEARFSFKEPAGDIPEIIFNLSGPGLNILRSNADLFRYISGKGSEQRLLGLAHKLFVFRLKLFQRALMDMIYLLYGPVRGEHVGKNASHIAVEIADYSIRHAEDTGKLQNTLVDQLQCAHIRKVVAVQEIEDDDIRVLPLPVTTVDALLDGQSVVRQIVVDDERTEFQIEAFRADIC